MRTSSASLNSSQNTIIIVSVVLGCLLVYLVYYFTTKRYVLTTNPSPFKNSKFQHFPCDLAVIENKWTHRRYTVELTPNEEERRPDGSYPYRDQVLHINSLKDRVSLYLQKVKSSTLVEVANEMKPDRFIDRTGSVVPRWSETNGSRPSPPMEVPRLFVESIVRPRDVRNGYQLGQLPVYEQTIQTVVRERVVERYKRCVMARCQPGTRPTFVKEYMKNGTVDGSGVTWGEIVPDLTTFTEEVFNEVKKRMGDDVFIYQYGISALKNKP
ncbi:hypothetical protein AGDE_08847 [Angomonas deanei]|uniref:Uncharacterized protein n=1 Tax=Angomonas deanei TaxID=59799 RepID=A0A7G2CSZ5_9TRYP|nr:hypothetical protein AGDE_08847 [Angomonas deanei]CAD2221342.1 hypothetical protein, conserved [Angomonas deanei]|eukprot:EPY32137.1 hypothetical protein AGDE_08847 [Angomonas deanei]